MSQIFEAQHLIGRKRQLTTLRQRREALRDGKGSLICLAGESGYGKTALLRSFAQESPQNETFHTAYADCQAPVGNFNVGNLQPFLPFARALEEVLAQEQAQAKKKLAINIGMTVLSTIPLAGDLFYAVKEISRDIREFRKDKHPAGHNTAVSEYFETLRALAEKAPLILLLDDMQWCDAQSVELLTLLAEEIADMPVMLVLSYRPGVLEEETLPFSSFLDKFADSPKVQNIEALAFTPEDITDCCRMLIPRYRKNSRFEKWLLERSDGIPGIVVEYLRYFQQYSPFDANGDLSEEFFREEFLPASVHAAFERQLDGISEEDRNILALCSAEGQEATAFVIAHLMNTDILTVIKKLRSLQNRTGILRSTGAHARYGVKTTVYEFGKTFYYNFFHNSLEYEEKVALHEQISQLLAKKFEEEESEEIRSQLAPYIAAHSAEAGDDRRTQQMLLVSARTAEQLGSREIVQQAYSVFQNYTHESSSAAEREFQAIFSHLEKGEQEPAEAREDADPAEFLQDFRALRNEIVRLQLEERFSEAAERAGDFIRRDIFSVQERAMLLALDARTQTELDKFALAEEQCMKALDMLDRSPDSETECFVLNALALLRIREKSYPEAFELLQRAARSSLQLPHELRLLTLANIMHLTETEDPVQAQQYRQIALRLSDALRMSVFKREVL